MEQVQIYTDGACLKNPDGPGGYGAVLLLRKNGQLFEKELSGGYANTTNNRMELMAVIVGLEILKRPCQVEVFSDSKYIVNAMNQGWVLKWKSAGWYKSRKSKKRPANIDLWKRMLQAVEPHAITFTWVKGHAGIEYNERCDYLATMAAAVSDLPEDEGGVRRRKVG